MRTHVNYLQYLSETITMLLMFCEDLDSIVRMNAEEQLYNVIRANEHTNIVRIQSDLYHEIKKNGNMRSLRISLQLLGHYLPAVKQSKAKAYATNLLYCIVTVSRRIEPFVIEALSDFLQSFTANLQICLNDMEVNQLLDAFVYDTTAECSVKKRCAAANVVHILRYARRQKYSTLHVIHKAIGKIINIYRIYYHGFNFFYRFTG